MIRPAFNITAEVDALIKTPSDYHVFGPLKEALHGRRYASDYEVQDRVHMWL
jgi:hypothetical protein